MCQQIPGILEGVRGRAGQSQPLGAGLLPATPKADLHVELQISSDLQWLQPNLVEISGQNRSAAAMQELGAQHPAPRGVPQTGTQGRGTSASPGDGPGLTRGSPSPL